MSLTNNGGGTVTIGVSGSLGGGASGTSGTAGSSGTSISLTLRKGISVISGVQSITLTGSIFLDSSGSNGAFLRVDDSGGAPVIFNGVVSSSQQIEDFDTFAVKSSANRFVGNQEITGSLISTATITTNDLYVSNAPNFAIPEGSIMVGGSGSRSNFISTASLGISGGSTGVTVIDQGMNITFTEKTKLVFTDDFVVSASGSDGVVISSVGGGGGSGDGFPFTGSAGISGSLSVTGNMSVGGPLTASAFAINSVGTPEIQSSTNINLTAGNAVVVSSSPLRLASYTNAQTGSIIGQNGDLIYNSTTNQFIGYASGSWLISLSGTSGTSGTNGLNGTFFGSSGTSGVDGTFFGSSGTSGLTISTGSFAVTGSNTFRGNQIVSGSVTISGSINQVGVGINNIIISDAPKPNSGAGNTIVGVSAANNITTGSDNTFLGYASGFQNTVGFWNTFVGSVAGGNNVSGSYNTFVGTRAGYNNINADYNTFIGQDAGLVNTSGTRNTFIGALSGDSNTTGQQNTFLGTYSGNSNSNGSYNTYIGESSGIGLISGINNTFLGYVSGFATGGGSGSYNTSLGAESGYNIVNANNNTFVGYRAGSYNQRGNENVAIGMEAGGTNISGSSNVFVGNNAGRLIQAGTDNSFPSASIYIGRDTRSNVANQVNQIVIGHGTVGSGSNTVVIGNNDITNTYLKGVVSTTTSFRMPSYTDAQTGSLSPQNGDMIYNTTVNKFVGYANGAWVQLH
jgi:hypothetical protein